MAPSPKKRSLFKTCIAICLVFGQLGSLSSASANIDGFESIFDSVDFADGQIRSTVSALSGTDPLQFPVSTNTDSGHSIWNTNSSSGNWHIGFFAGQLWLMSELSQESTDVAYYQTSADMWCTPGLAAIRGNSGQHDYGFMFMNAFGRSYQITGNTTHRDYVVEAAGSLSNHWMEDVGGMWSFNFGRGNMSPRENIIVDSAMNMHLLFWASKHGGSAELYQRALSHMHLLTRDHQRADGSTIQVIDYYLGNDLSREPELNPNHSAYDPSLLGTAQNKVAWQGISAETTWARGQGWFLHGMTDAYRETGDPTLLQAAIAAAEYYLSDVPADLVPYFDFDAMRIPQEELDARYPGITSPVARDFRDTSSAALAASAFLELARLVKNDSKAQRYFEAGEYLLASLSSDEYLATNTVYPSLLTQGVSTYITTFRTSFNQNQLDRQVEGGGAERGLIYSDMYFLEAIRRYRDLVRPRDIFGNDSLAGMRSDFKESQPRRWNVSMLDGDLRYQLIGTGDVTGSAIPERQITVLRSNIYSDFSFSFDFNLYENPEIKPDADVMLIFSELDRNNYNYLLISADGLSSGLYSRVDGIDRIEAIVSADIPDLTQTHRLGLSRSGSFITVKLDSVIIFSQSIPSLAGEGRIGFGSTNSAAWFDDAAVESGSITQIIAGYEDWAASRFGPSYTSIKAAPSMNSDGDPHLNFFEYVFGMDPLVADGAEPILTPVYSSIRELGYLEFQIYETVKDSDYTVWRSTDLSNWEEIFAYEVSRKGSIRSMRGVSGDSDTTAFFQIEVNP